LNFAIADEALLVCRFDFGFPNALYAIGAFFHHSAAADRDVRVALHLPGFGLPILKEHEIKTAHFPRAVVGAVSRSDTAVVDHVIQAISAVIGGLDGADQLAGRVFALHARHRTVIRSRIAEVTFVVDIDSEPVHGARASTCSLPTTAILFSAWHAMTQAWQLTQAVK